MMSYTSLIEQPFKMYMGGRKFFLAENSKITRVCSDLALR